MKRKGSMELGIQVIVILVIAMVILGLGIGFIRGFFTKGTESLSGAFDLVDLKVKPTFEDPIVLEKGNTLRIKTNTKEQVRIGIYNTDPGDAYNVKIFIPECTGDEPRIISISQNIAPSDSAGFVTTIDTEGVTQGNYICKIVACGGKNANTQPTLNCEGAGDKELQSLQVNFVVAG